MTRLSTYIAVLFGFMVFNQDIAADGHRLNRLLEGAEDYRLALPFESFARPKGVAVPEGRLSGRLTLDMNALAGGFQPVKDLYGALTPENRIKDLPVFGFDYIQAGGAMVPLKRGIIETDHPYFDYVLTPGSVWYDSAYIYMSLPFALMEKNANCVHNGVMMVRLDGEGRASNALMQIGSETCAYLQFNFWAAYQATWMPGNVSQQDTHTGEGPPSRLPSKPVSSIGNDHGGLDPAALAQADTVKPSDMTTFGAVLDGVHYSGDCATRLGPYPHCDAMVLPSYSLAKSLAGGLGLMALEKRYPGASDALVADYIPACNGPQWQGVTFLHLAGMTTGNYRSRKPHMDEGAAHYVPFFDAVTSDEKAAFSCEHFKRKAKPGRRWVYHTSDTYLLGVAMNGFLAEKAGQGADFYRDILVPLWQDIGLSPLTHEIRRTAGEPRQPFTGYGMLLTKGDIATLAHLLATADRVFASHFAPGMLKAAMQRGPDESGKKAGSDNLKYQHGFWGWNAREALGCSNDVWLPFFSGYGGISVVMLPDGGVYYYFSDGGAHAFAEPIKELAKVSPICGVKQ